MTDANIYLLTVTPLENALAKLLYKAYEQGKRVLVLFKEEAQLKIIDDSLWTAGRDRFLPHGRADGAVPEEQPILLSTVVSNRNKANFLTLVEDVEIPPLTEYEKCLDVLWATELDDAHLQNRLKSYGQQGITPKIWRQQNSGQWYQV